MDALYFQEYYQFERDHWWFRVRNRLIMDQLIKVADRKRLRILNIGPATGYTSQMLSELGEVISVEQDRECCELMSSSLGLNVICGSITALPFSDEIFDVVCAFDVLEHVKDDAAAVSEMKRVVIKGGIICVTVPAFKWLWSNHDTVNHHLRRYTLGQLKLFFSDGGMILSKSYFNFILFLPIVAFRVVSRLFPPLRVKQTEQSDFSRFRNPLMDRMLFWLFSVERIFLRNSVSLPWGVSILLSWRKA